MITTVVFTADRKAGNLARISLAARRLGYRSIKQSKLKSDTQNFDKIQLELEADHPINVDDLSTIKSMVPTVVNIQSTGRKNGLKVSKPTTTASANSERSADKTPSIIKNSGDAKEILNSYGKQIVAGFPNITHLIQRADDEIDASIRDDVMLRLGKGIGRWQYKKNYSLGAKLSLDKTLQRMLWPALNEFVDVVREDNRVLVKSCPHGRYGDRTDGVNCHFITGFLQGFMNELTHFRAIEIVQTHKKNVNGHCVFEVNAK